MRRLLDDLRIEVKDDLNFLRNLADQTLDYNACYKKLGQPLHRIRKKYNSEIFKNRFIHAVRTHLRESSKKGGILDLSNLIFPDLKVSEWAYLWSDVGGDNAGNFVNLSGFKIKKFSGSLFLGTPDFSGWKFGDNVSFVNTFFSNGITLYGASFGDHIAFSFSYFLICKEQRFHKSPRKEEHNFRGITFNNDISFYKSVFIGGTSFNGAYFGNQVSFTKSKFSGGAMEKLTFRGVNFGNGISFHSTIFDISTEFLETNFGSNISFNESKFHRKTRFSRSVFNEGVSFNTNVFTILDLSNISLKGKFHFSIDIDEFSEFASKKDPSVVSFDNASLDSFLTIRLFSKEDRGKKQFLFPEIKLTNIKFGDDGYISIIIDKPIFDYREQKIMNYINFSGTMLFQNHPRIALKVLVDKIKFHVRDGWEIWPPKAITKKALKGYLKEPFHAYEKERIYRQVRLILEYTDRYLEASQTFIVESFLKLLNMVHPARSKSRFIKVAKLRIIYLVRDLVFGVSSLSLANTIKYLLEYMVTYLLFVLHLPIIFAGILYSITTGGRTKVLEFILHFYYGIMSVWGEKFGRVMSYFSITMLGLSILYISIGWNDSGNSSFISRIISGMSIILYYMLIPFSARIEGGGADNMGLRTITIIARYFGLILLPLLLITIRKNFLRNR